MWAAMFGRRCLIASSATYHCPRHFVRNVSNKFKHGNSIELKVTVPPEGKMRIVECETTDELYDFVRIYKGALCAVNADGISKVILPRNYSNISPSTTYEIESPFFASMREERHHRQISDKAFEQKCREAMIRYLADHKLSFHELDRSIQNAGEIVAEWEGVFELEDGRVWCLECKNCVTPVCRLLPLI